MDLRAAAFILLPLLQPGCATTKLAATSSPAFQQAAFSLGDRNFQFDRCVSGDLEYFLGVDLLDQEGGALVRIAIDPIDGPRIRVRMRGEGEGAGLVLTRDQCRQLDGDVRYTGWTINTVRDFSGFLDAECRDEEGLQISLHVRFSHCH